MENKSKYEKILDEYKRYKIMPFEKIVLLNNVMFMHRKEYGVSPTG